MVSFIGQHLSVVDGRITIFMIQCTVVSINVFKFSSHRFIRQRVRMMRVTRHCSWKSQPVSSKKVGSDCGLFAIAYHAGIMADI